MLKRFFSLSLLLLIGPSAFAQRDAKIPDSDPEIERKSFIVAPGFEVTLYAADPLLAKPIQMNWDPQGRLWVATSETYPQILPGQKANDKIIILEDTKGVGVADKTTVFADGLLIPTGIEPGDGGAYVANSTEIVHFSASKPGGKADIKKVLLSGFGTEDTHHIIHTFRWGPDSNLYFNQSIYIHSHIETPAGVKHLNAGGIWKYNTGTNDLNVFARGWVNSWGHAFNKNGESFATDGAGGEGINHVVPGAYYLTSSGQHASRILHGLNPGSPKHCGLEILSGRHLPDDWQGNLITNDFRGHRVCRFVLSEDGSTFSSREMPELIKTTHPAFRPIDVKMGPDGAIYIADWYNPIIQHGEVDFRDPRRDKTHGRIWRVAAKNRPIVPKVKLVDATIPELMERLKDPEDWTRAQARRVLKERAKEVNAAMIAEFVKSIQANPQTNTKANNPLHEAVWLAEALNIPQGNALELLAASTNSNDRIVAARNATLIAPQDASHAKAYELLTTMLKDSHARVRLEAVRTLATIPSQASAELALTILDSPMDPTLDYSLWLTLRELESIWLPAFQKGELTFAGDPRKIAFALTAAQSPDAVKPLAKLIDSGKLPPEKAHDLYVVLARIGGPDELVNVLKRAGDKATSAKDKLSLVNAVVDAVRARKVGKPGNTTEVASLLKSETPAVVAAATKLAGLWKLSEFRNAIESTAKTAGAPEAQNAAIEALASFADDKSKSLLNELTDAKQAESTRAFALVALAGLDQNSAAKKAVDYFSTTKSGTGVPEIIAAFVSRRGGSAALSAALQNATIPADSAKLAIGRIRSAGANEPRLIAMLTAAGKLNAAKAYPTESEIKALATEVVKSGDVVRGEMVFRRQEMQCLKCHAIAGAGGLVGPDMTSLGASAQPDYLVESLLNPNAKVKEGYNAIQVTTLSGKQIQGVKIREADGVLVLRNAEDKEESIRLDDIDSRKESRSLMPDGLVDPLTKQEMVDLVKFLSELGKVGPYAPNPARLFRKWEYIEGTGTNTERFRRTRIAVAAEKENGLSWTPIYTRVSGELPLSEISKYAVWQNTEQQSVVRCHIDVTTAGMVRLKVNDLTGLTMFVNGKPVGGKNEIDVDLPVGQISVTMIVDRGKRNSEIKVELLDVPGSSARAKPVGGK